MRLPILLPRSTADPLLYFCDESHIRTSDWMGIGGLAVRPERAQEIESDLHAISRDCGLRDRAEVKWSKCKKRSANAHPLYIDYLFDAIARGHVHFHVRFSPFKEYDHNLSGPRRETDTISKSFYQLLVHRAGRYYGEKCRLIIRPDAGECTAYLPRISEGLNTEICDRFRLAARPIVDIAARDSRHEPMLQLLDVTLGALTAARNGTHENGVLGPVKRALVEHALERGRIRDISKSHSMEVRDFNIWNVTQKWTKGSIPTR